MKTLVITAGLAAALLWSPAASAYTTQCVGSHSFVRTCTTYYPTFRVVERCLRSGGVVDCTVNRYEKRPPGKARTGVYHGVTPLPESWGIK